jgi:hypothetical protein
MKGAQRCRTCKAAAVGVQRLLLWRINGFLVLVALSALVSIWFGRTGGD